MGVAEELLAAQHAEVAEHDVLAGREIGELDEALVQPLGVRVLGGEGGLDLLVVDDAPLGGVDEEHPPRLQPPLGDHLRRVDVDDADLGRHHDDVVVGDPVAARPQPVAVEHGADDGAVRERDAGRAVPRFHQRGVEAVERPLVGVHLVVVLPRRRDHHQHGVVDRTPGEVEQLEHLVEAGGVRRARGADRVRPVEVGEQRARQHRLPRPHPVLVALHRVDLAVVGDVAVGVGQRPRRERVGGEAAVDQQQGALEALVGEVGEERRQLRSGQHPLVDERARGQRREVRGDLRLELVLDALAGDEHPAVEVDAARPAGIGEEQVLEAGHRHPRRRPEAIRLDGDGAPGDDLEPFLGDDGFDRRLGLLGGDGVGGQERQPDGVGARRRQLGIDHGAEEPVGHLDEDPGAVAGVGFGPGGAAVGEVGQGLEAGADQLMAARTLDVGHEGDAARVVFESRVVEAHRARNCLHRPRTSTDSGAALWTFGTTLARTLSKCRRRDARRTFTSLSPGCPSPSTTVSRSDLCI